MTINTCSGAISLSRELETASAKIYQELAQRFEKGRELFLGLAKENTKFTTQIERAYYGVITDAIEGCFAFNLDPEEFRVPAEVPKDVGYQEAVGEAIKMEEEMLKFYQTAAEQSKHLMADVPRSFTLVAKKRSERVPKLKALLPAGT